MSLSVTSLTSYMSRIRRRESRDATDRSQTLLEFEPRERMESPGGPQDSPRAVQRDPLASAMAILRHPRFDIRQVHSDGDPTDKNLI